MKHLALILTLFLIFTGCFLSSNPEEPPAQIDEVELGSISSSSSLCKIIDGEEYCPAVDYSSQDGQVPEVSSTENYSDEECNYSSGERWCEEYSSEWYYYESSFDFDNAYEVPERERCNYSDLFEAYPTYNYDNEKWYCPDTTGYDYKVESRYTSGDTVYSPGFCNTDDLGSYDYVRSLPLYTPYAEYLALIKNMPAVTPKNEGVTLLSGHWKLVNEANEGIHVYDNSDPVNPVYVTFIAIPGNRDFVIKNNTLLANSYETLLALDFTTPTAVTLLKDIPEILINDKYRRMPIVSQDSGFVSGVNEVRTTEVYCRNELYPTVYNESSNEFYFEEMYSLDYYEGNDYDMIEPMMPYFEEESNGAMFALGEEYLYAVSQEVMVTINVQDETSPKYLSKSEVFGWNVMSVTISHDLLFVSGYDMVSVIDVSRPGNPGVSTALPGVTYCDELLFVGEYLYAASGGNERCYSRNDGITVVNISDKSEPLIEETYSMDGPTDIEIVNGYLYACDGRAGFKIFTVEGSELNLITQLDTIIVETVSVVEGIATLTSEDGVYTYDVTDPENPVELSFTSAL
ncbi:MAG: hypothetical protein OCD01_02420 [Fibrobacterales bacterium]